jgi:hypothetical protein
MCITACAYHTAQEAILDALESEDDIDIDFNDNDFSEMSDNEEEDLSGYDDPAVLEAHFAAAVAEARRRIVGEVDPELDRQVNEAIDQAIEEAHNHHNEEETRQESRRRHRRLVIPLPAMYGGPGQDEDAGHGH